MAKRNLTLKLDADLLRDAKVLAAMRDTSITAMVLQLLRDHVSRELEYEQSRQKALEYIHNAPALHWRKPNSRDQLHER